MTAMYERWRSYRAARHAARNDRALARVEQEYADLRALILRRGLAASEDALDKLFTCFGAVRGITRTPGERYDSDIVKVAERCLTTDDVELLLAVSGFDLDARDAWFERAENDLECCRTVDGRFCTVGSASVCEYTEEYYSPHAAFRVVVTRLRPTIMQRWEYHVAQENAFFCDISERWYSSEEFTQHDCEGGNTICGAIARDHGYYWHEGPEEYRDYPEDDENEDEEDSRIPSYHNGNRLWSMVVANRSTRGFYGLEIEVEFGSSSQRYEFWKTHLSTDAQNRNFCGEHDGSLSDTRGMEIVTRPFALQELRDESNPLRALLAKLPEYGGHSPNYDYGVHVNTNWGRLSLWHRERMRNMVFNLQRLSQFVAQRKETGYCYYGEQGRENYGWHYSAVHARDDVIPLGRAGEFRIFRSTTDYNILLSYVEYVDALTEWTRDPARPIAGPMAASLFRHWVCLSGNYPALMARFPKSSAKELHPCVLPSSSRPIEASPKKSSTVASGTTRTERATLSSSWSVTQWLMDDVSMMGTANVVA